MTITTVSVEETDKIYEWVIASRDITRIKHIIANKKSAHQQIAAIRKLLAIVKH